jgi:hypothetical protein
MRLVRPQFLVQATEYEVPLLRKTVAKCHGAPPRQAKTSASPSLALIALLTLFSLLLCFAPRSAAC